MKAKDRALIALLIVIYAAAVLVTLYGLLRMTAATGVAPHQ